MIICLLCLWLIPAAITLILSILDVSRLFSFYSWSFLHIGLTFVPVFNWLFVFVYILDAFSCNNETTIKQFSTYRNTFMVEEFSDGAPRLVNVSQLYPGSIISVEQLYSGCCLESGFYTKLYTRLAKVINISKTDDKVIINLNGKWSTFQIAYFNNQSPKNEEEGELSMDFAFDEELEIKEVDGISFFIDDGKIHNIPEDVLEKINEFKKKGKKIVLSKHTYSDGEVDFMVEAKL